MLWQTRGKSIRHYKEPWVSRDPAPSYKLCVTLRERRRSHGELAEGLAGLATSGEASRRYRVGRTTPGVDFCSAGCLIRFVRGGSRELSGDPSAVDARPC